MHTIPLILKDLSGAPQEFQVLPKGKIEMNGAGEAVLNAEDAAIIIAEFKRRGIDMVIDYEHQTMDEVQAPAAGWIKELVWKGAEGLWAVVEWTQRAKEYLANKEYRYFSPVVLVNEGTRRIVGLINVALTNMPRINNLKPLVAKDKHKIQNREKEETMIEKLKKLLGLEGDAGEDKIIEAVTLSINKVKELTTQAAGVVACKEVLDALGAQDGDSKEKVVMLAVSLKAPADVAKTLSLEVAELKKKISEMGQTDLIQLALKEGKTSPEELDKWGRDLALKAPDQFKLIVLSRPAGSVIPVEGIQFAKNSNKGGLDDNQRLINGLCGVDDDTYKKYNK